MVVSLILIGLYFLFGDSLGVSSLFLLVFFLFYVFCCAVSICAVVFVLLSEMYPTKVRGLAMSIAGFALWIGTYLIGQLTPWMLQYLSISSSDFPVVSGTSFQTISIYGTHMRANRKNVPAGVRFWSIQGVNCPIRYVPIHRANLAIDMASPRTLVGYISERSTNTTAQIDTAQQNT